MEDPLEEYIDVLDECGEKTGEALPKRRVHELGLWHRCFHCWVVGEGRILFQRRSADKETWPGWLDVSAAGHISAGETSLEGGIRELEEEIGLAVHPRRLIPLGTRTVDFEVPEMPFGRDREFHDVFILLDSTPPGELRLQREEVEAVLSMKLDDVPDFVRGKEIPCKEFGHSCHATTTVHISEFVDAQGEYLSKVYGAAKRLISGQDAGGLSGTFSGD